MQSSHLALDLVCFSAQFLYLTVVIPSLYRHFLVLALQTLDRLLACKTLVFNMPLRTLELFLRV